MLYLQYICVFKIIKFIINVFIETIFRAEVYFEFIRLYRKRGCGNDDCRQHKDIHMKLKKDKISGDMAVTSKDYINFWIYNWIV